MVSFRTLAWDFIIAVAFCNKTVAFCNNSPITLFWIAKFSLIKFKIFAVSLRIFVWNCFYWLCQSLLNGKRMFTCSHCLDLQRETYMNLLNITLLIFSLLNAFSWRHTLFDIKKSNLFVANCFFLANKSCKVSPIKLKNWHALSNEQ